MKCCTTNVLYWRMNLVVMNSWCVYFGVGTNVECQVTFLIYFENKRHLIFWSPQLWTGCPPREVAYHQRGFSKYYVILMFSLIETVLSNLVTGFFFNKMKKSFIGKLFNQIDNFNWRLNWHWSSLHFLSKLFIVCPCHCRFKIWVTESVHHIF